MTRGAYIGSRFTKKCSKFKIQEHYGFYERNGKRMFDDDCLTNEFLLTSEDMAIDMTLLKYLDEEVVQGAYPFSLKAKVYNSVNGYSTSEQEGESYNFGEDGVVKPRKKRRYVLYKIAKSKYIYLLFKNREDDLYLLYIIRMSNNLLMLLNDVLSTESVLI